MPITKAIGTIRVEPTDLLGQSSQMRESVVEQDSSAKEITHLTGALGGFQMCSIFFGEET